MSKPRCNCCGAREGTAHATNCTVYLKNMNKRIAELTQQLKDSEGRCKARDKVIASLEQENERLREAMLKARENFQSYVATGFDEFLEEAFAALNVEAGDER